MKRTLTSLSTVILKLKATIQLIMLLGGALLFSQVTNASAAPAVRYSVSGVNSVYVRAAPGSYAMGRLYNGEFIDIHPGNITSDGWAYGLARGVHNRCLWVQYQQSGNIQLQKTRVTVYDSTCATPRNLSQSEFTNGEIWNPGGSDGMGYILPRPSYTWDNWNWHARTGINSPGYAPAGSAWLIRYTTNDGGGVMARKCNWTGSWSTTSCESNWKFIQRSAVDTIHCGYLAQGEGLGNGQTLNSCDARFSLTMQQDGNLVLYQNPIPYQTNGGALWATGTYGNTGRNVAAFMQTDGNFVVYAYPFSSWIPLWHAGTYGQPGSRLALQDDGNLVIYNPSGNWIWASHTCCR